MQRRLISVLFVCTGASGLIFEVLWVKQLTLVVSSSTFAMTLGVSTFLGGLMIGSEVSGRLTRRLTRPLRAYAIAELLAGVLASAVTLLLPRLPELCSALGLPGGGPLPVRIVIVALVLLPPSIMMGTTLPLLSRYVVQEDARIGADIGTLYTLNTLGAVIGCGFGGFVVVSLFGVMRTSLLASAVNLAVGTVAFVLARSEPGVKAPPQAAASAGKLTWLEVMFFVSGFASIAYEVLWFRVLRLFFDPSTYAFTVLLCAFLLGLVLGGALYVRRWASHPRPLELLTGLQSGVALAGLVAFAVLGLSRGLSHALLTLVPGPWGFVLGMSLNALIVVLPPTILIGAIFPLVVRIGTESASEAGARVGRLYAVNTLGGILGSLVAGFVLIPLLGTQLSYALVCLLSMSLALWVQRRDPVSTPRARKQLAAVAVMVLVGLFLPPRDFWTYAQVGLPDANLLALREGRDGTLSVQEYTRKTVCDSGMYLCDDKCPEFAHRRLSFGSISYASTILPARRYMRFQAHVAMLLRPAATEVLEVCFGTGTTAGAFASHPQMQSLTLVDLNPDIFDHAPLFVEVNHDVLKDPRVHPVVDDGRHFLLATDRRFDVVSFEPPPPVAAGVVNLYSRDFYELVKARLKPGGVVTQWVPLDQTSSHLDRALVRAMSDVFKHVSIYIPSRLHGIVVGSDEPLGDVPGDWPPAVLANLADVGFENADQMQGTLFAVDDAVRRYVGDVPAVTDDRPSVEHFLFEDQRQFEIDELLPGPASNAEQLRVRAYQAVSRRQIAEAKAFTTEADALQPGNSYGKFLREIEYGCLVPAH